MKEIMYGDCNNNIEFIKEIFHKIGLMVKKDLMWSVSNLDLIPKDSEDYNGVGGTINNSRQRVYLVQQRILNEHTIVIEHKELMELFNNIRTIYEGIFIVVINGRQNRIAVFDGDIISIQGDMEDLF